MKYIDGIEEKQYKNITVKMPYNKYTLTNALIELSENFPNMKHVPNPTLYFDYEYIAGNKYYVRCSDTVISIGLKENYGLSIPPIPYNVITKISFDTFIDKSKLVSIWIDTIYGLYTVSMNN